MGRWKHTNLVSKRKLTFRASVKKYKELAIIFFPVLSLSHLTLIPASCSAAMLKAANTLVSSEWPFLHRKWIIFSNCGWDLSSRKLAHAVLAYLERKEVNSFYMIRKKILEPVSGTSRRGARAAYHDEYPRDFGPRIAYTVSLVSDTCRPPIRQGGREMSAPRPYETYPFLPHSSVPIL